MGLPAFRAASEALLARRRDQKGFRTLGDEHDRALVEALSGTRLDAEIVTELERVGEALGHEVYSRQFFGDDLPGATTMLARCLIESGLGTLRIETHFHRTATLHYAPPRDLAHAPAIALVSGVAKGYFASAFNCTVHVEVAKDRIHLRLLQGRDVNRGSSA